MLTPTVRKAVHQKTFDDRKAAKVKQNADKKAIMRRREAHRARVRDPDSRKGQ